MYYWISEYCDTIDSRGYNTIEEALKAGEKAIVTDNGTLLHEGDEITILQDVATFTCNKNFSFEKQQKS